LLLGASKSGNSHPPTAKELLVWNTFGIEKLLLKITNDLYSILRMYSGCLKAAAL
jgi:hypothetical protein